jgi:hypothetical protein
MWAWGSQQLLIIEASNCGELYWLSLRLQLSYKCKSHLYQCWHWWYFDFSNKTPSFSSTQLQRASFNVLGTSSDLALKVTVRVYWTSVKMHCSSNNLKSRIYLPVLLSTTIGNPTYLICIWWSDGYYCLDMYLLICLVQIIDHFVQYCYLNIVSIFLLTVLLYVNCSVFDCDSICLFSFLSFFCV